MNLILQTDAQARAEFSDSEQWRPDDGIDHGARPTPAMLRTLADIAEILPEEATLTICRDWEGCPVGIIDMRDAQAYWDVGLGDVIALTETGRIGSGGVNMPRYYDSVLEYAVANLQRRLLHAKSL